MGYVVERTIEDVEFPEEEVERLRKNIKKEMIDEGEPLLESKVESRLMDKLENLARQRTMSWQGHNDLHRQIEHGEPKEQ